MEKEKNDTITQFLHEREKENRKQKLMKTNERPKLKK